MMSRLRNLPAEIPCMSDHGLVGLAPRGKTLFQPPDFRVKAASAGDGKPSEIFIYDDIGPAWAGMIDAVKIVDALGAIGAGPVTVRINSRGGDVVEGIAIFNALRRYSKIAGNAVLVGIDSLAASAASLIAMAGSRVEIASNGSLMIHKVWTTGWGNESDFRAVADILQHYDGNVAKTYSDRTGIPEDKVLEMMAAETWMNADEAVEAKFADAVGDAAKVDAPQDKAGWYRGPEPSTNGHPVVKRFSDVAATDRAVTLRRKQFELL